MKIIGKMNKTLFFPIFSNFYLGFPMILSILAALGSGGPPELQKILENWKNLNKNWKKLENHWKKMEKP